MADNNNSNPSTNDGNGSRPNDTVGVFLSAIYEVYFQPLESPLTFHSRLLYAFFGSISFFLLKAVTEFITIIKMSNLVINSPGSTVNELNDILNNLKILTDLAANPSLILIIISIGGLLSLMFAFVISAGYSKHGPIRYFIAGLLLPAFTYYVSQLT